MLDHDGGNELMKPHVVCLLWIAMVQTALVAAALFGFFLLREQRREYLSIFQDHKTHIEEIAKRTPLPSEPTP